ncbi:Histone-lysine N-methyltransferase SETMAR [Eumeta japonica]|uniref:Histone-lysine N-methyltransferase SETMAR n=1 Tax=Eumeta variegata TaxID=151549 RepID=A0A4C1SUZ6_EUMVA|nr:Histone-lysine N-methyltransferase SETMAR [Eumeta japonica]
MIYYVFRRGLTQKQCIDHLTSIIGDEAPSKTTVDHWFSEFNRGRNVGDMLKDEFKESRLKSVVPLHINAVQDLIMHDRHVTFRKIKVMMNLGPMRMTPKLNNSQRCGCSKMSRTQQKWFVPFEVVHDHLFAEVFEEIRKNNRQRRIILHHDNASCHTSTETTRFLEGQKIKLTGHPPYGPDLAPNDFYLLPSVKNKLRGQRFSNREEAVDAFKMHFCKYLN